MAESASTPVNVGGYPKAIFTEEPDHKYLCNFCGLVLKDPVQIFCGHRFCRACIESHASSGERCKQCEEEGNEDEYSLIQTDQMFPDNAVRREMTKLAVQCPNKGCDWKGIFRDFENHASTCIYLQGQCPDCKNTITLRDYENHKATECPQRVINCKRCKTEIKFSELEYHDKICPKATIQCPVCGKKFKREKLDSHTKNECSSIQCPVGCGDLVDKERVHEHLDTVHVSRHFEAVVVRQNNMDNEIKTEIPQIKASFDTLKGYLNDKITALERQLVDVMNNSTVAVVGGGGESSGTIDHRVRQALETQQGRNNEKFQQLEVKTGTFEGIVSALHREIEKTIAAIERIEQNRRGMKDTMEQNQLKIRTLERTLAVKDVAIAELEMRVQSSEFASYDGAFYWKVSEFTKKQQDAIQGRSISIYSPPFFTSRRGYKMCARLYANGDGMGKGSHLSLFFVVMRGQYDALQSWPFKQRVTFCLVNQGGKEHVMDSFRPDPSSSSFKRPTTDMNIASGCPLFLRLENLQNSNNGYLKDDTLFVKIMVDLNDPPLSEPLKTLEERINVSEIATSGSI